MKTEQILRNCGGGGEGGIYNTFLMLGTKQRDYILLDKVKIYNRQVIFNAFAYYYQQIGPGFTKKI